jgi:DNA-damage-inducible protein J
LHTEGDVIFLSTTQVTFRIEEELKKQAESLFYEMGINMTTALNAFIKATVREGKMPFELVSDEYAYKMKTRENIANSSSEAGKLDDKYQKHTSQKQKDALNGFYQCLKAIDDEPFDG